MQTSKEIFSDEKRIIASKGVLVQLAHIGFNKVYFNVIDPKDEEKIKYIGKITDDQNHSEYCTCPDNFHRNTEDYKNTHALAFQCKHQIAFRVVYLEFKQACKNLENEREDINLDDRGNFI